MTTPWWVGAKPHPNIQDGKVNEALFEAKLGEAISNRGPDEYRKAEIFFQKTLNIGDYLTGFGAAVEGMPFFEETPQHVYH